MAVCLFQRLGDNCAMKLRKSWPLIAAVLVSPSLVQCVPGFPGGGGCPSSAEAAMDANFGLAAEAEGKVKAALADGAALEGLAVEVEADVASACGDLARDLGATDIDPKEEGPGKKAEAACNAAAKAIGALRAKAK